MKKSIVVILGLLLSSMVLKAQSGGRVDADAHLRYRRTEKIPAFPVRIPRTLVPGTFQQDVDHFGHLPGQKFAQRFWVESSYASSAADAPILFHICGEGDATQGYFLNDNAIAWARTLGAHIVYLEHRYYGRSQPFPDLSAGHLKYLTLDNVIEDLAAFQKWMTAQKGWKGAWISLGGSYSGTLSALYRQRHPELVVGALASSAPMISGVGRETGTQEDVDQLSSTDASSDSGDRQWAYQACTTFGFWEAEGPDYNSPLDLPSPWLCQKVFGNVPRVNYDAYNQNDDLPFLTKAAGAPTHLLFTYGSDDVWTRIGLAQQTNENPGVTIYMIDGAGHHFDLNPPGPFDSSQVTAAREVFVTLARQWLAH